MLKLTSAWKPKQYSDNYDTEKRKNAASRALQDLVYSGQCQYYIVRLYNPHDFAIDGQFSWLFEELDAFMVTPPHKWIDHPGGKKYVLAKENLRTANGYDNDIQYINSLPINKNIISDSIVFKGTPPLDTLFREMSDIDFYNYLFIHKISKIGNVAIIDFST